MKEDKTIAVCGLVCEGCEIRRANSDKDTAQKIADWFKNERGEEVKPEDIRCLGCRGDRSEHWSPDCWILKCCVDDKGLDYCHQCGDFPCVKLSEWAEGDERYGEAVDRLKGMKQC